MPGLDARAGWNPGARDRDAWGAAAGSESERQWSLLAPEMLWGRPMSCRGAGGGEQTSRPRDTGVVLLMPQDDEVLELAAAHYADDFNEDTAVPNVVDACRLSRPAAAGIRARSRVGSAGCRWYEAQCVWGHGCIWHRAQYVRRRGCSQEPPSA